MLLASSSRLQIRHRACVECKVLAAETRSQRAARSGDHHRARSVRLDCPCGLGVRDSRQRAAGSPALVHPWCHPGQCVEKSGSSGEAPSARQAPTDYALGASPNLKTYTTSRDSAVLCRHPLIAACSAFPYSFFPGNTRVPTNSQNSKTIVSGMPGSHPQARRVRASEISAANRGGNASHTEGVVASCTQQPSARRRMSVRLVGAVQRLDQASDAPGRECFGCMTRPATVRAETASGWLTLCDECLKRARRAQVRFDRTADSRAKLEQEFKRSAAFARHGMLSGGGANGTGGRR
jgi:hypothetical protein